jgi:AraC-like DNA-binding protein
LQPYIEVVESRGLNANRILSAYGLRRGELNDPYNRIPFYSFLCVTQGVADLAEDPCIGLRVGAEIRSEQVGSLGLLMAASATLRQALSEFSRWGVSMNEGWSVELVRAKRRSDYIYRILIANVPTRQDIEYSIANLCSLIRSRMGATWAPEELHFTHSSASNLRLYEKIFRCPVYFEQPQNKLVLSNADLDQPAHKINHALRPIIEAHFRFLGEETDRNNKLSTRIASLLSHDPGVNKVSREKMAEKLGMSVRTMQRRLADEGTTLKAIATAARRGLVEDLLSQSNSNSLTDIAIRAGYSDGSALSRAYKHWTGASPNNAHPRKRV